MSPTAASRHLRAIRESVEAGQPAVVAIQGDGATGTAAALLEALGRPCVPRLTSPVELPETGAIWLHDAVAFADAVLEGLARHPRPVVVLLTGDSVDAGRPADPDRLRHPGDGTGVAEGWTEVPEVEPITDDPAVLLHHAWEAAATGQLRTAFALNARLDRLGQADQRLSVLRLVELGRYDDAERAALAGARLDAEMLLLLVRVALGRCRATRARNLISVARRLADRPETLDSVRFWTEAIDGERGARLPRSDVLRAVTLHRRWSEGDAEAGSLLEATPGPTARILERRGRCSPIEADVTASLALADRGAYHLSRALCPRERDPEIAHQTLFRAERFLLGGDAGSAAEVLDTRPEVGELRDAWGAGWHLLRAVAAALLSDGPRLHRLTNRLATIPPLPLATLRDWVDCVSDARAWERLRLSTAVAEWTGGTWEFVPRPSPDEPPVVGEYVLEEPLGVGGMGTVWAATHVPTGRAVAVKLLKPGRESYAELFEREVEIATRLDHEFIVSVLDHGAVHPLEAAHRRDVLSGGQAYLVMERVDGGSLAEHAGLMEWPTVKRVLHALLDALAYAHAKGLVHRDIKPGNVLVGDGDDIRLTDFGLAGLAPRAVAGTPSYMAPEQFTGAGVDGRADLFALGCLGWAMATGLPPRVGASAAVQEALEAPLPAFEPLIDVPEGFADWLAWLLQNDPSARPASAAEAAVPLLALPDEGGSATGTPPATPPSPSASPTFTFAFDPLGGPAPLPAPTATGRPRHPFVRRNPYRPRLPTLSLMERGDPAVEGHHAAREALARALDDAARAGDAVHVLLVGPRGVGRRTVIRSVREDLRLQGLFVASGPTEGLALIDVDAQATTGWVERARGRPWVVVHGTPASAPADARTIELKRMSMGQMFWVVRSRLPVSTWTATEITRRAVGLPRLALILLRDLVEYPGLEATSEGLKPARPIPARLPGAVEWWTKSVAALEPEPLAALQAAAILDPPFRRITWEQTCGALGCDPATIELSDWASEVLGWWMPPSLRSVVLSRVDGRLGVHLHLAARHAEHFGRSGRIDRARHALLARQDRASLVEFVSAIAAISERNQMVPAQHVETLDAALDVAGAPATHWSRGLVRHQQFLHRRAAQTLGPDEPRQLLQLARRNGWKRVEAWTWRMGHRHRLLDGETWSAMIRAGARSPAPQDRLLNAIGALDRLVPRGEEVWRAALERLRERARQLDLELDTEIVLSVAYFIDRPDLMPPPPNDPQNFPSWVALKLHQLLQRGAYAEIRELGQRHPDAIQSLASGVSMLNLGLADAALGLHAEARERVVLAAQAAAANGYLATLRDAHILALVLSTDRDRQWEDFARLTTPPTDPDMIRVVRLVLDRLPDGPRKDIVRAMLPEPT